MTPTAIQSLNIQDISANRLFFNIHRALGLQTPGGHYWVDGEALPEEHFRVTRLVLQHLLGEDTGYSNINPINPNSPQGQKLFLIYQSEKAWKLYANVMGVPESGVTPWQVHQFFARMAWLDESVIRTAVARTQLEDYLYGLRPYRGPEVVLDLKDYPELDGLLTPVPEDLRSWMVQFKRGAHLMPLGEWIARSSGRSLYRGLSSVSHEEAQSPLGVFCKAVSDMLPSGEYRDRPLSVVLGQKLAAIATWWRLEFYLKAASESGSPCEGLQLDFLTPNPIDSRAEFYRKVAAHVVNPDDEAWLADAISRARNAPGMCLLSLATELRFRYSQLELDSAMALAALLLRPELRLGAELSPALPTSRSFNVPVPGLETWSAVQHADDLFQKLGIGLLCRPDGDASVLRWRPSQTWHALIQTAQFKSMFAPLLGSMKWYGALASEQASPRVTQALAGRAIVDCFLGATQAFAEPLAKTLRGAWVCQYSHVQLCAKVRSDIKARQPGASPSTLEILYYLLLREEMPELLVEGVPDHLQYGRSLQSVALNHGVALVEGMRPGHSLAPQYDDLIGISVALAQSSDARVHALWARMLTIPALRYALAHGAIEWSGADDMERASAGQVSQALNYLKTQQEMHASELNDLLSIKPADRKHLAQQMLTQARVDLRLWDLSIKVHNWPILQEHGFRIAASYSIDRLLTVGRPQATVLELVMMGEAYIEGAPTIPEAYAIAFDAFQKTLVRAEARVMARLLSEMQATDRNVLLSSTCEVSRVAFGAEEGAHGLFIRCQPGDHRSDFHDHKVANEVFYELIPAGGVIRKIVQRFQYKVEPDTGFSGNIVETVEKRERNAERAANALVTPLLPMDGGAYLKGTASRSSVVYQQPRQGVLIPCTELIYLPDGSEQARLEAFVRVAASHLFSGFLGRSRTEHEHVTQWEAIWAKEREYADIAARLIVPFYGCIKDLTQGDHSAGVVVGCVMDVAFALIPAGQFVASTASIVLKAGEMSVLSVFRLTGKAVARLMVGLAEQSAVFAVRDVGRLAFKVGRLGWARLLEQVPALKKVFASQAFLESGLTLDRGMYRVTDSVESPWRPKVKALDKRAIVDGRPDVIVRNVGTPQMPDFRLLDPDSDAVFGKALTSVSKSRPLEFSVFSAADGIAPGRYPAVLPIVSQVGDITELRIAEGCSVQVLEREEGVFDILVDDEIYHLEAGAPDAAMRKLGVNKLSSQADGLRETLLCRVGRNLIPVACPTAVKLATPVPEPVLEGSSSPKRTGKYPSHAMDAREFTLDRLSTGAADTPQHVDVFVYEGKFCKWAEPSEAAASTSSQVPPRKMVVVLSQEEREALSLPDIPIYLQELDGTLSTSGTLGIPANYPLEDARFIYEHAPVIEFGAVAQGVNDARTLRGIRIQIADTDWIFVEPDIGVFYKARTPADGSRGLRFSRTINPEEINEFIRLSEQYRLVRERPAVTVDRENIARLLFDLLDETEREVWQVSWSQQIKSYEDYTQWCIANGQPNELLGFAGNILAGEDIQKKFVELARQSIPDFKKIGSRSVPETQHIVEVINRLFPVQGSKKAWSVLSTANIGTPKAIRNILGQIRGANISFAQVYTESGERVVYYALSGGEKAKDLKLKIDVDESTEHVFDGVIFRDARARMAGRQPDPRFTSLPVVRDASRTLIRDFSRDLDAERLIATVLKEDMVTTRLSHIRFFTVLDTCRSCGGFVLPRLKLDFPDALFSVTYLKDYTLS